MDQDARNLLRSLLLGQRLLALAVLVDDRPVIGQVPFALRPDGSGLLIHVSRLARHTAGLTDGAPFSALLQLPDLPEADPLQVPRLTLEGKADLLERGSEAYEEAAALYQQRLPTSAITFQLGDFRLVELIPEGGRLVGGFARALSVRPEDLKEALGEG